MKPPLSRFRVSVRARDRLLTLKRRTGIEHWNVLCRWAFIRSVCTDSRPDAVADSPESNVELSWQLFAGEYSDVYCALLAMRAARDGIGPQDDEMGRYFRLHVERGIAMLLGTTDIVSLCHGAETAPVLEERAPRRA